MPSLNFKVIESASALNPEALSFLKHYDQQFFPTPWTAKDWDQLFSAEKGSFILIIDQGFVLFQISFVDSFAHLLKIVVSPAERNKGLGKELLKEAIRFLKERGINTFFLEVEEHNLAAVHVYQQLGFKIIHKKTHFYSSGATALIMTLTR